MKVYLVGGALRDKFLKRKVLERDWVVVGATPEEMIKKGYSKVGKDFPVFLHPKTREEFALARTERKIAPGYSGFSCEYDANVTLVDDLKRRDLTINAMAMDEEGKLIDPYDGYKDLEHKILRHVSHAFAEDPLRVLRVARFHARYYHLGFKIAPETLALMYKMVRSGELQYLSKERVWQEFFKSLGELNPEVFILTLRSCGALEVIMPALNALFGVPIRFNDTNYVDSGIRSIAALQNAVKLTDIKEVRFAALLHNLYLVSLDITNWPIETENVEPDLLVIKNFCKTLKVPTSFEHLALLTAKFHNKINDFYNLNAQTIVDILEKTDAFRRPDIFNNLLLASIAVNLNEKGKMILKNWQNAFQKCREIDTQSIIEQGIKGKEIRKHLHLVRVQIINKELTYEK